MQIYSDLLLSGTRGLSRVMLNTYFSWLDHKVWIEWQIRDKLDSHSHLEEPRTALLWKMTPHQEGTFRTIRGSVSWGKFSCRLMREKLIWLKRPIDILEASHTSFTLIFTWVKIKWVHAAVVLFYRDLMRFHKTWHRRTSPHFKLKSHLHNSALLLQ